MIPEIDGTQFSLAELTVELRKYREQSLPVMIRARHMQFEVRRDNILSSIVLLTVASEIVQIRKERNG